MVREKLDFHHKDLLYDRLNAINTPIAEYSFPNLYLFRKTHEYELIRDEEIFIQGKSHDGFTYLMPTVPVKDIALDYLTRVIRDVDFLFPIPETWLSIFPEDMFAFESWEGDTDYVYEVEKMSTYKGRRLHRKRNLLKQFMELYKQEARPLTEDLLKDALFILDDWQNDSGKGGELTDYWPCKEALQRYEDLVLCGGIYFADNEPAGFLVGEELNEATFVLHFSKGRKKFKGIYQYMFNNFSKILPHKYKYLNLEQDLNDESLRFAKSSYQPDFKIKKIRVSLK